MRTRFTKLCSHLFLAVCAIFLSVASAQAVPPGGNICIIAASSCIPPTLSVAFTATPTTGYAPLTPTLKATVSGTATGTINYTIYCDRADTGTNITSGYAEKKDNVTTNPYKSTACTYTTPGTYTVKIIVERSTAPATQMQIVITVPARPSLQVDLTTTPSGGAVPFIPTLTATVSGSATGTINYVFYCNRSDAGTNVTGGYADRKNNIDQNPYSTTNCRYGTAGTYTAKVIVERGAALPVQATVDIVVTPSLSVTLTTAKTSGYISYTPKLTARVAGTATGPVNYTFYCDESDTGTTVTAGAAENTTVSTTPYSPYSSTACTYTKAGTYTAKVIVARSNALPTEAQLVITVLDLPTLTANLTVVPATGVPVLQPLMTVDIGGSATGVTTLTFYCTGTTASLTVNLNTLPYVNRPCKYTTAGTYTVKVHVKRGLALPVDTSQTIVILGSSGKPPTGNSDSPFNYSSGSVEY